MPPAASTRRPYKLTVRLISVVLALGVMAIYSVSTKKGHQQLLHRDSSLVEGEMGSRASPVYLTGRRLFSHEGVDSDADELATSASTVITEYSPVTNASTGPGDDDGGGDGDQDNCTAPRGHHPGYNDSCTFVREQCSGEWVLFDYLGFILCDMMHVQVSSRSLLVKHCHLVNLLL